MNRYIQIRRLRGPAFLLLVGVTALLRELGVIDHWFRFSWPIALILFGVFMLAERAALAADGGYDAYPGSGYPGTGYPGSGYPGTGFPGAGYQSSGYAGGTPGASAAQPAQPAPAQTSIVPAPIFDLGHRPDGENQ